MRVEVCMCVCVHVCVSYVCESVHVCVCMYGMHVQQLLTAASLATATYAHVAVTRCVIATFE